MDFLEINVSTIFIILILGHLLTALLIVAYAHKRGKSRAVDVFLLSKLVFAIAWGLLIANDISPCVSTKILGSAALFAGAIIELIAFLILRDLYGNTTKKAYSILIIVVCSFVALISMSFISTSNKIAVASLCGAILGVYPVLLLFSDKGSSMAQKLVSIFYGITGLLLVVRAFGSFFHGLNLEPSSTSVYNTAPFLWMCLVMLSGSIGFILLDKEKTDREMIKAASFDELTDILNRRAFIARSKEILSLFARRHEKVSFLLIDIDDFKKINDAHGHYIGDKVLSCFAQTIKKHLRAYDLFGRYGGEEFAVLLPGADEHEAGEIAERLRSVVENSLLNSELNISCTISIGGVTFIPKRETNVEFLYRWSDNALYTAKTKGKNCVSWLHNSNGYLYETIPHNINSN